VAFPSYRPFGDQADLRMTESAVDDQEIRNVVALVTAIAPYR
jgi:hypothetical protein